jgi:tRNA threonylcarbamoyladenosine biosynthesis protein TsaB
MLLLVTDTSGRHCSVALARARTESCEVEMIEALALEGGNFSALLVPQIAALLAKHGFSRKDIGAFIVVAGPGSFTGLRVGLAAIKALAEILQKPIVPVSLLEVVALAGQTTSKTRGKMLAALDASRGDLYVGDYDVEGENSRLVSEQLMVKDEFLSLARDAIAVTPDEALAVSARDAGVAIVLVAPPDAARIARLGWRKLQAGETVSPAELDANYIRRTDAEIFAKPSS